MKSLAAGTRADPRHAGVRAVRWAVPALLASLLGCGPGSSERALTTVGEIRSATATARSGPQKVRFRGAITLIDRDYRILIVQNESGGLRVECPENSEALRLGQLVEVTGSAVGGSDPFVARASVTLEDKQAEPEVAVPPADDLYAGRFEYRLVQVRGVVRSISQQWTGRVAIELGVGQRLLQIRSLGPTIPEWRTFVDSEVIVVGVVNSIRSAAGAPSTVRIWVTRPESIKLERKPEAPAALPIISVRSVMGLNPHQLPPHRLRLSGKSYRAEGNAEGILTDQTGAIVLRDAPFQTAGEPQSVELTAFADYDSGRIVLNHCVPIEAHTPEPGTRTLPELQRTSAIRKLSVEQAGLSYPVRISGVVTYFDPVERLLFVQDGDGGIFIDPPPDFSGEPRAGDLVRINGVSEPGDFAPSIAATHITPIGKGQLPAPSTVGIEQILQGQTDSMWVELTGVVESISPDQGQFSLDVASGIHRYKVRLHSSQSFAQSLRDATVRLRGACGSRFNSRRQLQGIELFVAGPEFVHVERAAPELSHLPLSRHRADRPRLGIGCRRHHAAPPRLDLRHGPERRAECRARQRLADRPLDRRVRPDRDRRRDPPDDPRRVARPPVRLVPRGRGDPRGRPRACSTGASIGPRDRVVLVNTASPEKYMPTTRDLFDGGF